jgi:ketosteroid isomerase-like protein
MRAALCLGVCLVGCATAPPPVSSLDSARNGIDEGNRLLTAAVQVGNGERVATVFTDDATILPFRQAGLIVGRAAIAEYWSRRLATTRMLDFELRTLSVDASGNLAYEIGTNRIRSQTGSFEPVTVTGRYLAVWRKGADGTWRIQADCPIPDPQ